MDAERFASFWRELRRCLGGQGEWTRRVAATTAAPEEGEYMVMLHILPASASLSAAAADVGGRLAVLGGAASTEEPNPPLIPESRSPARARHANGANGGGGTHGLWALDIDAATLRAFEEDILEYDDVDVFAQEFAQALLQGALKPITRPSSSSSSAPAASAASSPTKKQPPGSSSSSGSGNDAGAPAVKVTRTHASASVQVEFRLKNGPGSFTLSPLQTNLTPALLSTLLPFFHLDRRGLGRHPPALTAAELKEEDGGGEAAAAAGAGKKKRGKGWDGKRKRQKNAIF